MCISLLRSFEIQGRWRAINIALLTELSNLQSVLASANLRLESAP